MEIAGHIYAVGCTLRFQSWLITLDDCHYTISLKILSYHRHHCNIVKYAGVNKRGTSTFQTLPVKGGILELSEVESYSLWNIVQGMSTTSMDDDDDDDKTRKIKKIQPSPKYIFFGHLAMYGTCISIVLLLLESMITPWLVSVYSLNDVLHQSIAGMNFSLHACSVYYFIFYRSVEILRWKNNSNTYSTPGGRNTLWSCALCTSLLGFVRYAFLLIPCICIYI
jgi:hypothetical protein